YTKMDGVETTSNKMDDKDDDVLSLCESADSNTVITIGNSNSVTDKPNSGKKRKNICGVEKARRRKQKLALTKSQMEPGTLAAPSQKKRGRSPDASSKVTPPSKKAMDTTPKIPAKQRDRTFKDAVEESLTHCIVGGRRLLRLNSATNVNQAQGGADGASKTGAPALSGDSVETPVTRDGRSREANSYGNGIQKSAAECDEVRDEVMGPK
ncbi:hypothetical protein Bhyg_12159, partial [Pseudolycoriella hygida]